MLIFLSKVFVTTDNDKLIWKHKKNGIFSVKSYYEYIMGENGSRQLSFLAKQIWEVQAPPKIAFFFLGGQQKLHIDKRQLDEKGKGDGELMLYV